MGQRGGGGGGGSGSNGGAGGRACCGLQQLGLQSGKQERGQ